MVICHAARQREYYLIEHNMLIYLIISNSIGISITVVDGELQRRVVQHGLAGRHVVHVRHVLRQLLRRQLVRHVQLTNNNKYFCIY